MPRHPNPVTQADYDRVRELHAQGLGRNAIAREIGRGERTVSRLAAEQGLSFDRKGATAKATEAKKADGAARRAQLQLDALEAAHKLMGQMFQPALVYNFGGKENDYNSTTLEEPPFADKRNIATAIQALAATALKLAEYDKATGNESEKSMLTDLRQALIDARKSSTP
ncbi:hypothetical protein DER29_4332 [Micromonospora sp. M71_S20]|uniref:helix-turn-helix domain-containing protein n=1 Tax=Micromonospora sp. M71_S20 TaxID=592872 RepID=UPI000EB2B609|nr:helix-turn-helix domain-containing protein [Micromonospora sp. M71_S20]RLK13314.1 hypothetical protein DER29_4332 [Micromonospora sp. M71_S20]